MGTFKLWDLQRLLLESACAWMKLPGCEVPLLPGGPWLPFLQPMAALISIGGMHQMVAVPMQGVHAASSRCLGVKWLRARLLQRGLSCYQTAARLQSRLSLKQNRRAVRGAIRTCSKCLRATAPAAERVPLLDPRQGLTGMRVQMRHLRIRSMCGLPEQLCMQRPRTAQSSENCRRPIHHDREDRQKYQGVGPGGPAASGPDLPPTPADLRLIRQDLASRVEVAETEMQAGIAEQQVQEVMEAIVADAEAAASAEQRKTKRWQSRGGEICMHCNAQVARNKWGYVCTQ